MFIVLSEAFVWVIGPAALVLIAVMFLTFVWDVVKDFFR